MVLVSKVKVVANLILAGGGAGTRGHQAKTGVGERMEKSIDYLREPSQRYINLSVRVMDKVKVAVTLWKWG